MAKTPAKILIIGRNGQLARALVRSCRATAQPFETIGSSDIDLSANPLDIAKIIRNSDARAVINASAYTAVDRAESEPSAARKLNAKAPGVMAAACQSKNIPFIHISTDYVFDGTSRAPHHPHDKRAPINVYGTTKAAGERAVQAAGGHSTIIRTSWVYDGTGQNFLTTMLRLGAERDTLNVVDDQFGRPTYAGHLAEACLKIIQRPKKSSGLYHISDSGKPISWKDFATAIFKAAHIECAVTGIPSSEYPTSARRPENSVMDISDFERDFGHPLMPWKAGLRLALSERKI